MPQKILDSKSLKIHIVSDGLLALDGGAMFGVVPKVLWKKTNPPDELNRIDLGTNCLVVQTKAYPGIWKLDAECPDHVQNKIVKNEYINILVNTGIGDKFNQKFLDRYKIRQPQTIPAELLELNLQCDDIDLVILTHLHFDHAGGNTKTEAGEVVPTYKNAAYIVQAKEWEIANHPFNSRLKASYLQENITPINDQVMTVSDNVEILLGIRVSLTGGHSLGHQIVEIDVPEAIALSQPLCAGTKSIIYLSDLIPTTSHLSIAYCMAYDVLPLQTMEQKEKVLKKAKANHSLLIFEHDASKPYTYLE